jgi:hypothetical protein
MRFLSVLWDRKKRQDHPLRSFDFSQAASAKVYAHLFENKRTGLARNLYWTASIEFEPLDYLGEQEATSMTFDWLIVENPQVVSNFSSAQAQGGECSWYLCEHFPSRRWELSLEPTLGQNEFLLNFSAEFDFPGLKGDPCDGLLIEGTVRAEFTGITVAKDSLYPKPTTPEEAQQMIVPYFANSDALRFTPEEDEYGWPICSPRKYRFILE